jgi:hypothetical protein
MKKPVARAVRSVGPDLVSGRGVRRAVRCVGPFRASGAAEGTASRKVRPYHELIASCQRFGIRVHPVPRLHPGPFGVDPWFNGRYQDYRESLPVLGPAPSVAPSPA